MYKGRLVLARGSSLISQFLQECHDSKIGGHSGFLKIYERVAANVYWVGMKDIHSYVAKCEVCQKNKYATLALSGLQPLPISDKVWDELIGFYRGASQVCGSEHYSCRGGPTEQNFWSVLFKLQGTPSSKRMDNRK